MPRRHLATALLLALVLVAAGCGGDDDQPAPSQASAAPAATDEQLNLKGACPDTVIIQTDWDPEAEYGVYYHLLGPNPEVDTERKRVSAPLVAQGRDTGVRLEVRTGGPSIGFEPVSAQMYKDKDITLGQVSTDEAIRFSDGQPTQAVVAPMEVSPFMIMWDPETYPQFQRIADIGKTDTKVFYFEGDTYMEYLIAAGVLQRSQVDGSYDGKPANFVAAGGKAAQAGFATSEPYIYEKEVRQWAKPVRYALVNEAGYPFYPQALSVRAADRQRLAPCLEKLVPIVQRAQVTVQYVGTGADDEDVKTQLALDLRTGGGPDVFTPDGPWVGEFAQAGFLKPLEEVVGAEVNDWDGWSQIPKPVAGIVEFEGKRYGVPVGTDGRVLFFNKTLFAKAGLPTDWHPGSWDEVLAAARQLKAKLPGVTPLQLNAGTAMGEATTAQGFIPLLYGTGKNLLDGGKWLGDTPETQAVLGFYDQLYGQDLGDARLQLRADGRDRSFAQFADNKIAVLLEGDYFWRSVINPDGGLAPMKDRDEAVGWALIPARQPGGGLNGQDFVSLSGGAGRVINPNTKAPKEAWELLKFLNSKEALTNWVQREARITSRSDVNQANLTDPLLSFISERVLPITATRPGSAVYPQVSLAIQTATENVVAGRSDAGKAAGQLGAAIAKAVGADNVTGAS